jgi:membrane protein implicated in regulation of membrane protease activity
MTAEIESSPAAERRKATKLRSALVWIAGIATLALLAGVVGVVIYGLAVEPALFGFNEKKPWNYLDVFLVPVVVTVATGWLTWAQHRRQRKDEEARQDRERQAEEAQKQRELKVENQRAQDEALAAYLDEISQLLTDEKRPLSRAQPGGNLSTVARARTLTALFRLDGRRKRSVLQFLYESDLLTKGRVVVDLKGANLSKADLGLADLSAPTCTGPSFKKPTLATPT